MANPYALDFNPLASAISDNQQLDLARNRLAMDQKRLGFEAERLGFERDQHPLRLEGLRLGNTQAQQGVTRETAMLPLDIKAKNVSIAGQGLQNQGAVQNNEAKRRELEKDLYDRTAAIAQMIEGEPDEMKRRDMLGRFYSADPRIKQNLSQYLPKEVIDDPVVAARYMRAVAAGYQSPQVKTLKEGEKLGILEPDPANPKSPGNFKTIADNPKNEAFKDEHQLRGELSQQPTVKNFSEVKSGYQRMTEGREINDNKGSGAGDLAIVYGYMKMLDPTSVVREGEFATAEKTAGIPQQVVGLYNKVISGERLPPAVREEFMKMAGGLYQRNLADVTKIQDQYRQLAIRNKLNPNNVILDLGMAAKPQQGPALPRFNPAPQGMRDAVNGRGVEKPVQEQLAPTPQQTQMPRLQRGPAGDATYNALPSGTRFIDPDGNERIKR